MQTESFGTWLKDRRKIADLSRAELGSAAGCSPAMIHQLENDARRPSKVLLDRLMATLRVPPSEQEAIRRLARPGPAAPTHPPPRPPADIPVPVTPLLGREADLERLDALLQSGSCRLLTLVGPAGVGKTRLGLAIAQQMVPRFGAGVVYVPLADLVDAALVEHTLIQRLNQALQQSFQTCEGMLRALGSARLLLIIDNVEHVLDCADLLSWLVERAPGLSLVATSREPLGIYGEYVYPVAPLAVPLAGQGLTVAALNAIPASQLLLERLSAQPLELPPPDVLAPHIAEVCALLDGLPLALELAASRARWIGLPALIEELYTEIDGLRASARNRTDRQTTLEAALDWSYRALTPTQQEALARLSVFPAGLALPAAQAVWPDLGAGERETAALLQLLTDKSLLRYTLGATGGRWTMLHVIRLYAGRQLAGRSAESLTRQRYVRYCCELISAAYAARDTADNIRWVRILDEERNTVRAALGWLAEHDRPRALQMVTELGAWWLSQGHQSEGAYWINQILPYRDEFAPADQARLLYWAASFLPAQAGMVDTTEYLNQSLAIFERLDDREGASQVMNGLAALAIAERRLADAEQWYTRCLATYYELDQPHALATVLNNLSSLAYAQEDYATAQLYLEASLAVEEASGGSLRLRALIVGNLGEVVWLLKRPAEAERLLRESVVLHERLQHWRPLSSVLETLVTMLLEQKRWPDAVTAARQMVRVSAQIANQAVKATALRLLMVALRGSGDGAGAATLAGTLHQWAARQPDQSALAEQTAWPACIQDASLSSPSSLRVCWEQGAGQPLDAMTAVHSAADQG